MRKIVLSAFRNKNKYTLYGIMLFIIFVFSYIIIFVYENYAYQIKNVLGAKEINRGLVVYGTDLDDFIKENKEITISYPIYNNLIIDKITINVYRDYDLLMGKKAIKNDEIVISKYFYNILNLNEEDILEEKKIKVIDSYYKIAGVTSNNSINIFMTENNFKSLDNVTFNKYYLLVDKYINVTKIQEKLLDLGYASELNDSSGLLEIEKIMEVQQIYKYILIFCLLILVFVIYLIIKNIIKFEEKNIALLKAIGYKNKTICLILFLRIIILFFGVLLINYIPLFIINILFFHFSLAKYLVIEFILGLLVILFNLFIFRIRLNKLNVLEILNEF